LFSKLNVESCMCADDPLTERCAAIKIGVGS
jgi:hypothetical protein